MLKNITTQLYHKNKKVQRLVLKPLYLGGRSEGTRPYATHTYGSATQCLRIRYPPCHSKLKTVRRTVFLRFDPRGFESLIAKEKPPDTYGVRRFLVGVKGLDSRRRYGGLVARGHNSPPDCCSVPLVLRVPITQKNKRRNLTVTAFIWRAGRDSNP